MKIPNELKYTRSHEWVQMTGEGTAKVGLTDFAQQALGGIVFVNLPDVGDELKVGESFADVESVKAVSDVFSPFDATVSAANDALLDAPELINDDPYGAWLIAVEDITGREELLTAEEYEAVCKEEE